MKKMKKNLRLSSNNWEYCADIVIECPPETIIIFEQRSEYNQDSMGDPAPDTIIINDVSITFDEGFEVEE